MVLLNLLTGTWTGILTLFIMLFMTRMPGFLFVFFIKKSKQE